MSLSPFAGEIVKTVAASGSALELSLSHGTIHDITLSAACSLTMPAPAAGHRLTVVLRQDATGSRVVSWPNTVTWPGGASPTLSTIPLAADVLTFLCVDGATWVGFLQGYAPVSGANAVWNAGDTICRPSILPAVGGAASCATQQIYWMGGPGMIVPAGQTVRGIEWVSNAASVTPTHQWFALGLPDETGLDQVTVLATSKDDTTTAWGANVAKKLSLLSADGGSGAWTASVDTPVYAGVVQVAATPATIKGIATSAADDIGKPKWWGAGPAALNVPSDLAGVTSISATSIMPAACRISNTST